VLRNVAMMLVERQVRTNRQLLLRRERGEAVALVVTERSADLADHGVVAAGHAAPRGVALIDMTARARHARSAVVAEQAADVLTALDNLLCAERTVIVMVDHRHRDLGLLLRHLDRVVCLLDAPEERRLKGRIPHVAAEWIATGSHTPAAGDGWTPLRVIPTPASERDRRWLGRHLSRTKLGLALGAGGAKGFAHVGVQSVLEDAGYEVDVVTGSSIGGVAAACIAMGMRTGQVRRQLSHVLSREVCGPYFRLMTDGQDGPQLFYDALSALAGDATCDGLALPLGVLTADLNAQLPHAFTDGPLAQALHAALAIPGLAPPYLLDERRLIDGVAISPVPVQLARQLGADITIAVNLMSRIVLDSWPDAGGSPVKQRSSRMDPVIETIIMLQTDTSVRNGEEADVTITPGFARSSWRDIHLGREFEQAGRTAALEQLHRLEALVQPSRG
jgi:NTE family protein